jgi:hypothetical protein
MRVFMYILAVSFLVFAHNSHAEAFLPPENQNECGPGTYLTWAGPGHDVRCEGPVCPSDTKLCADGTAVYRAGTNCRFPACPGEEACPMDAKVCPDGTIVTRSGPGCTFAPCPGQNAGNIACPMDAKVCPNGSTVGRTEPGCRFPACPH